MPLTRAQDEEILKYLLNDVLRADDDNPIRKLFDVLEIKHLSDLVGSDPNDFFTETYEEVDEEVAEMRTLPRSQANRCKHLRNLVAVILSESGTTSDIEGWKSDVTHEKFMLYCANPRLPAPDAGLAAPVHTPAAPATSQTNTFLRGNKRDISA